MAERWTVVTRFKGGSSLAQVVEAEVVRIDGGALVFVVEGEIVKAYGPHAWTSVTPGGPGPEDALPEGAQVFRRG